MHEHQNELQSEGLDTTQINVHRTTEKEANNVLRTEDNGEHHRPQQTEIIGENTQEQNGQVSQNHTEENIGSAIENNVNNTTNTSLNNNQHNRVSNNTNVPQVPEDRRENSQNYF